MVPALMRLTGFTLLAGLAFAVARYPSGALVPGALLLAYLCLLQLRPSAWLVVVPALLPVLDLSPWTGEFYFGEFELLLLASAAAGYIALAGERASAQLPGPVAITLAAYACVFAVAAVIGLLPLERPGVGEFATYSSRYNALRVFSGPGFALLLLPLLLRVPADSARRLLGIGMVTGLVLAALAVTWERAAFPGLLNFAADYRTTGPFFAMHTGGAALDAWLALSFPFAALWVLRARSLASQAFSATVALLGLYASVALFSRDIYLAYGGAAVVAASIVAIGATRAGVLRPTLLLAAFVALGVVAFTLTRVFASSGYRGLAAALALLVAAAVLSAVTSRPRLPVPALAGLVAAIVIATTVDKGAYLAVAASATTFAAGLPLLRSKSAHAAATIAVAAFAGLAAGAVAVAVHWGGSSAALPSVALALIAVAIVAVGWARAPGSWRQGTVLRTAVILAVMLGTLVPASASYYLGTRFATTRDDLAARVKHWRGALALMDGGTMAQAFGSGLGRYPDRYFWGNPGGETPGALAYVEEGSRNVFLRLGVARYQAGYGEALRVLQQVDAPPGGRYVFSADIRRNSEHALLQAAVCERWLIYPQNCSPAWLRLGKDAGDTWRRYEVELRKLPASPAAPYLRPPTQLELAAVGAGGRIDIDNVSLVDMETGVELVRNGSFARANQRWFFSSDRSHLPWHVKNFAVNTLFETGWAGLATMGLLLACVTAVVGRRALGGDWDALAQLAALTAFMLVGLFDSLFDVPRLAFAFFLLLAVACMVPVTPRCRPSAHRPGNAAAPP